MMDLKNYSIALGVMLIITSCSAQKEVILKNAKMFNHKKVDSVLIKQSQNKLIWVEKQEDIPNKKYVIEDLQHNLSRYKKIGLSDTTYSEKVIINLLEIADTLIGIKRIVVLTEFFSGESLSSVDYVYVETKKKCIFISNRPYNELLIDSDFDVSLLNNFMYYIKNREEVPEEKYLKEFDFNNVFYLYEITSDSIYANQFFTTSEFHKYLKSIQGY